MKARGFTLIELMIVVAVVAIIAAIAFPSYQNQVQKTRRADAQSALLQAAQVMERCFTRTNTYVGCGIPGPSPDGFYTLSLEPGPTATSYTIVAAPQPAQANDPCGSFELDHRGNKSVTGTDNRCWGN